MRQTIAFGVAAQQGNWPVQEDGYFVEPQGRTFALADGFGGRGGGDLAARLALREVGQKSKREDTPAARAGLAGAQAALFRDINKNILDWNAKRGPGQRGGTSLALAQISLTGLVTLTNCGATAAGLLRQGACQMLLPPQAAPRTQPGAPLLPDQALGLAAEVIPESRSFQAITGDLIFLVSSGVDFEAAAFQAELLAQWGIHLPGDSMTSLAEGLLRAASPEWNTTFLALEIP